LFATSGCNNEGETKRAKEIEEERQFLSERVGVGMREKEREREIEE